MRAARSADATTRESATSSTGDVSLSLSPLPLPLLLIHHFCFKLSFPFVQRDDNTTLTQHHFPFISSEATGPTTGRYGKLGTRQLISIRRLNNRHDLHDAGDW